MKHQIARTAAALAIAYPLLSTAADWTLLARMGDGSSWMIDRSSVATKQVWSFPSGGYQPVRIAWVKAVSRKPVKGVQEYLQYIFISCDLDEFSVRTYIEYDSHGRNIKTQDTGDDIFPDQPIPPDSAFDMLKTYLCQTAAPAPATH